jgi:hypothetical protein
LLNVVLHDQFSGHNSERPPVEVAERTRTGHPKGVAHLASKVASKPNGRRGKASAAEKQQPPQSS